MKIFNSERPLWLYKLLEYLLLFDGKSEEERLLAYRYGWHLFSKNKLHFEDFSKLIIRRKWFIYLSLVYPILIALLVFLLALSVLTLELWAKISMAVIISGVTGAIINFIIGNPLKNLRETKIFLNYINPSTKLDNFREFERLDFEDITNAEIFYENMRAKRDFSPDGQQETQFDKTEKLLALDILLGEPGRLNEFINKLCLDPGNDLSKKGIYRVLGKILGASPDNIQREVTTGVEKIRTGNTFSVVRIEQLRKVKEIFKEAKLYSKANEIDQLISNSRQC